MQKLKGLWIPAEILLNEDLGDYLIDDSERYDQRTFHSSVLNYQIYPIIKYLENMHINSSDYQINKVGYLYRSIEDKTLKDRCGDILLGETAFDRAVNQATQILEDRIKKKRREKPAWAVPTVVNAAPMVVAAPVNSKKERYLWKTSSF